MTNECIINGVHYKCRTCFDPGSTVFYLKDEWSDKKTWRDLFKELTQLQTNEDEILPNTVCSKCLDRLMKLYDFILQIHNVNKHYNRLLSSFKYEDQLEQARGTNNFIDCLIEPSIDIPAEEFISEIKVEKEEIASFDDILASNNNNETSFPSNLNLQDHLNTYIKERPFKCTTCEKSYLHQNSLTNHRKSHTGEEPSYHCTYCQKSFNRTYSLKRHLRTHTDQKSYICDTSDKRCLYAIQKKDHRGMPRKNELSSTLESISDAIDTKRITPISRNKKLCPICGTYLSCNTSLTKHMRTHTGEKPHKCDFCEKSFITNFDLKNHRRIHTAERPFKCTHCDKSFSTQEVLRRHNRIHTGERPYKCKFCPKTFQNGSNYKLHVRLHTGEKPYRCDVCDQTFSCGPYLKKHRIAKGHAEKKEN